ncbi:MAG: LuxR C-terminal-related transcriptional regulator [Candidatus Azobacteroides sp.]|nr:LuxR C-terminal-related transcriptional regulator [Candidatus Azobacteroides sp.]
MKGEELQIALITPYYIQAFGLKMALSEFFQVLHVDIFETFEAFEETPVSYDRVFIDPVVYLSHSEACKERKKIVLLTDRPSSFSHVELSVLDISLPRKELLDELEHIYQDTCAQEYDENSKELSEREKEVLELVVKGYISKEIAGMLNISLYTVQTHRKNISAKLGIKSASALTVYAMMNGIISPETLTK